MDGTVLVADDDRTIRTVLTQALTRAGCRVHATSSLTTLMRWVAEGRGDVVISDVVMPDGNGLEMLPKIAVDRPDLPVIIISAQNTIMTTIQATGAGAYDYLPKPFDLPDLMARTARALRRSIAMRGGPAPVEAARPEALPLVGRTGVMQDLYRVMAQAMNTGLPVLIYGESGTGKTLIARTMHELSDRRTLPLVSVAPGDLHDPDGPAQIMARAGGGTIVLEALDDLEPGAQGAVVRMMDVPGEAKPQFIGTRLKAGTGAAGLRDDLYYRLSGVVMTVPPLRQRVDDIGLLATHFLSGAGRRMSSEALERMRRFGWPGNVRQLENMLLRIGLTAQGSVRGDIRGDEISAADVAMVLGGQPGGVPDAATGAVATAAAGDESLGDSVGRQLQRYFDLHGDMLPPAGLYSRILRQIEPPLIKIALDATNGNQARCADLLGINRNTLRKKITGLDIRVTRRRKLM